MRRARPAPVRPRRRRRDHARRHARPARPRRRRVSRHPAGRPVRRTRREPGSLMEPVVDGPEQLTPGWLTEALQSGGHDLTVAAVDAERIGTGQMGATYRLRLGYARGRRTVDAGRQARQRRRGRSGPGGPRVCRRGRLLHAPGAGPRRAHTAVLVRGDRRRQFPLHAAARRCRRRHPRRPGRRLHGRAGSRLRSPTSSGCTRRDGTTRPCATTGSSCGRAAPRQP